MFRLHALLRRVRHLHEPPDRHQNTRYVRYGPSSVGLVQRICGCLGAYSWRNMVHTSRAFVFAFLTILESGMTWKHLHRSKISTFLVHDHDTARCLGSWAASGRLGRRFGILEAQGSEDEGLDERSMCNDCSLPRHANSKAGLSGSRRVEDGVWGLGMGHVDLMPIGRDEYWICSHRHKCVALSALSRRREI